MAPANDDRELKGRALKQRVRQLLDEDNFQSALEQICRLPPRRVINPLFSFLYHGDLLMRWRSVSAMGRVVSHQAESDMASAQTVMRRLMWNLNDESGGIGWGSPEAMGEIMACSGPLAREYHHLLISYMNPGGNFLEHELLQQGVLWGLGRLFHARPELHAGCGHLFIPFLKAPDAARRGLAAWAVAPLLGEQAPRKALEELVDDTAVLQLYTGRSLVARSVGELARQGLGEAALVTDAGES